MIGIRLRYLFWSITCPEYPNRKLMAWANRNGFYYLLDRETGEFLTGGPFIRQNWNDGLDAKGPPPPTPWFHADAPGHHPISAVLRRDQLVVALV